MPGIEATDGFWSLRVRDPGRFKKGSFRTQDVGIKRRFMRTAGVLKSSGKYATQRWLFSRNVVSVRKEKLIGKDERAKKNLKKIRANLKRNNLSAYKFIM